MRLITASAVDPLNVSGATIYSSTKFVPQIAPEVGSLIMILPFGIDSECTPLSQNQFEFHSNILLIFTQNIPLWKYTALENLSEALDAVTANKHSKTTETAHEACHLPA